MELSLRRIEERPLNFRRENPYFPSFERMDELFDQVFGGPLVSYAVPECRGAFSPIIDVKESPKNLEISAEMPGMNMEDIDVSVHDGVLTISGEKKAGAQEKEINCQYCERSYGFFERDIVLPDTVETENVGAVYKNGVLTVTVPKTEKAIKESHKISVSTT